MSLDAGHTDPEVLKSALSERLGATVTECTVCAVDYVRDSMDFEVQYLRRAPALPTPAILHSGTASSPGPLARAAQLLRVLQRS